MNDLQSPLRTLIVGCGVIGLHHAKVLTRHPDFVVSGLTDPKPEAVEVTAAAIAEAGGAAPTVYADLATALDAGEIDLAVICTPSGMHIEQSTAVLGRGIHVVLEKPLDVSVAKGREFAALAASAAERGVLASVISQHRFDPASVIVRRAIEEDSFGRVTSAVVSMAWLRSQEYYDSGDWRGTWALDGGGAVINQGVHTVDLMRWFLGRPVEIYAHTAQLAHERIEIEDTATATVRFESGALAVIHCTTAAYPGLSARLQVHGSRGSAIIDNDALRYFHAGDGAVAANLREAEVIGNQAPQLLAAFTGVDAEVDAADEITSSRNDPDTFLRGHLRQYDNIAAAIRDKVSPLVTVDEALLSLALVRALYVSATLGEPVQFEDILAGRYDEVVATVG